MRNITERGLTYATVNRKNFADCYAKFSICSSVSPTPAYGSNALPWRCATQWR